MPKLQRMTAAEAEKLVLSRGFFLARSKGSHRIYMRGKRRVVIPFHAGDILHPKIVKQILSAVAQDNE